MKCKSVKMFIFFALTVSAMLFTGITTTYGANVADEFKNEDDTSDILEKLEDDSRAYEGNVYTVGIFDFPTFLGADEENNLCGYAGEYLNKISEYSGVEFEYVYVPFDQAFSSFMEGKYDIYAGARKWQDADEFFDYSAQPMGVSYLELYALKDNNKYAFDDYEDFDGMVIGYLPESNQHKKAIELLKEKGVNARFIPFRDYSYKEYEQALEDGKVEAIIATTARYNEKYISIAKLDCDVIYFGVNKDKEELVHIINRAMNKIMFEDPGYRSELFEKYYGDNVAVSQLLTRSERQYVENNSRLDVYFCDDCGYLSEIYGDNYRGIQEDIIYYIADKAGFDINIVNPPKGINVMDYATDGYINLFPSNYHFNRVEDDFAATIPYLTVRYYLIENINNRMKDNCKIAVSNDISILQEYIETNFKNASLVYYENYEDCLEAVKHGECDITFTANYIAEYYLKKYEYVTLSMTFIDFSYDLCFFVPTVCDPMLVEIMSKCLKQISDTERQAIVLKNTTNYQSNTLFRELIYVNPIVVIFALVLFIILIISLVCIGIQASSWNRQQQNLSIALERAKGAAQAKTDFLSRMSHDIRTPLNGILGITDITLDDGNLSDRTRGQLTKISDAGKYLMGLINDVLDMSKIESGKIYLHEEMVDGQKFLESIVEMIKPSADKYGITIKTDFEEADTPWVIMDKLRTQQIYMNLLNNAIKFSPEGSTVEWIIIDEITSPTEMDVISIIKDQGCGMSEEFLERMFEPFEQEDNIYKCRQHGTGLGLGIVKSLVDLMGGTIEVESTLGVGTTFTIKIHRQINLEQRSELQYSKKMNHINLKGKRILLCEDHPLNVEIAEHFLKNVDVCCDVAENGIQGVTMFEISRENYYDAILMDIRMPLCDGIEATKKIRALDREDARKVPIIAMSANAFEEDVRASREAGMNEHLGKPINSKKLYSVLWKYLGDK